MILAVFRSHGQNQLYVGMMPLGEGGGQRPSLTLEPLLPEH